MKEEGALLAGEMSGHLFFADRYFGFDDAIYAALRLLEILANDRQTIGEMLADVPQTFTTPELRVDCPDAIKFDVVEAVTRPLQARTTRSSTSTARASSSATARGGSCARRTPVRSWSCASRRDTEARRDELRGEVEQVVARGARKAARRDDRSLDDRLASFAGRPTTFARAASRTRGSTPSCSLAHALGIDRMRLILDARASARAGASSRASAIS